MKLKYLELKKKDAIATIWLNRPEVHNAFHDGMISELIEVLKQVGNDEGIRLLTLRGKGKSFSAGADIKWMSRSIEFSFEQNLKESLNLSDCLYSIYSFPKPTIAIVHGACFGGANGVLAACDFVIAHEHTTFSLSEVKIGLIPACIAPYILKRLGEYNTKSLMLRGDRINSVEALKIGLVNFSGTDGENSAELKGLINDLLTSGPEAVTKSKKLIEHVANVWTLEEARVKTAEIISKIRSSDEGQEGMKAFLEKRKPCWMGQ
ncbi:MAG: methylglutaconyl-CoA hydratase [Cyclobacteriaceae bacterium]|jgi:methylglutaconyl-CoA hydratase